MGCDVIYGRPLIFQRLKFRTFSMSTVKKLAATNLKNTNIQKSLVISSRYLNLFSNRKITNEMTRQCIALLKTVL